MLTFKFFRKKTLQISVMLFFTILISSCSTLSGLVTAIDNTFFRVNINEQYASYHGPISDENVASFINQYNNSGSKPKTLLINSIGGGLSAGIYLGLWLHEQNMDVEVGNYCFSACANYIFSAGNKKYLSQHSVLGWHGGGLSRLLQDQQWYAEKHTEAWQQNDKKIDISYDDYMKKSEAARLHQIQLTMLFFDFINVNQLITVAGLQEAEYFGPALTIGDYVVKDSLSDKNNTIGFYYTVEDMKKFGLQNIVLKNGTWQPKAEAPLLKSKILLADLSPSKWAEIAELAKNKTSLVSPLITNELVGRWHSSKVGDDGVIEHETIAINKDGSYELYERKILVDGEENKLAVFGQWQVKENLLSMSVKQYCDCFEQEKASYKIPKSIYPHLIFFISDLSTNTVSVRQAGGNDVKKYTKNVEI